MDFLVLQDIIAETAESKPLVESGNNNLET